MRNKNYYLIHILFLFSTLYFAHCDYTITIKLRQNGFDEILSPYFSPWPDEIYLNGKRTTSILLYIVDITNHLNNIVELKWYSKISSCANMFKDCRDIAQINLTDFDTSNVKNMSHMFSGCSSLSSLILTNMKTSQVTNMDHKLCNFCFLIHL